MCALRASGLGRDQVVITLAGGRISREGAPPTDALLVGNIDLAGLGISLENAKVEGAGLAQLRLGGAYPDLTYTGELDLAQGKLSLPDLRLSIQDIEGIVELKPGRMDLVDLRGTAGGGRMTGTGTSL